jgi:hypothetical protein
MVVARHLDCLIVHLLPRDKITAMKGFFLDTSNVNPTRVSRYCLLFAILWATAMTASAQELTVTQLLQSPRQFEGRRVSVSGYYYGDSEVQILYADVEAAKRGDLKRSVYVAALPPVYSMHPRRAFVIGVFFHDPHAKRMEGYGTFGLFSSQLINCTVHLQREAANSR